MSTIYVKVPPALKEEMSIREFEEKWRARAFPLGALFYMRGMEGWKPVIDYKEGLAEAVEIETVTRAAPGHRRQAQTMPLGVLSYFVIGGIWFHWFAKFSGSVTTIAVLSPKPQFDSLGAMLLGFAAILGTYGSVVIFIVTAVLFATWSYRAKVNCQAFANRNLEYTPASAVWWYFVPFANLVMPYKVMLETWQVSTNPRHWRGLKAPAVLVTWWTMWLLNGIIAKLANRFITAEQVDLAPGNYTMILIGMICLSLGLAISASMLVWEIHRRQESLLDQIQASDSK